MKLRDFMANSFPRVRGRRGKKCQPPGTANGAAASLSAAAATVATVSATPSPKKQQQQQQQRQCTAEGGSAVSKSGRHHGHWFQFHESPFGFLERLVGKESPVKRLFEGKDRQHHASAPTATSSPPSTGGQRVHPEPEITARKAAAAASGLGSASPYGCVGLTDEGGEGPGSSCWCSDPDPAVSVSCPAHSRGDFDSSSLYAGCYGYAGSVTSFGSSSTPGSQRGLRSRSRIRTNPWLPSPRPSPYCVRSLSSPCASSSRSLSPSSSSPAPPSSSDNTSPLTSHGGDANAARERQLQRHRHRHRRHNSEINAADLTRHFAFESYLTDTEQYFSTLDSGIGETTTSPDEKDKSTTAHKKHRAFNAKRRSSERDPPSFSGHPKSYHPPSASPSPKIRTRPRPKTKSASSKGVVVNRDSQFWDSDSSRSPPRVTKAFTSKASAWDSDDSGSPLRRRGSGDAWSCCDGKEDSFALSSRRYLESGTGECSGAAALSLACEDICFITSNIEQLAQNISFEYEESLNASFESAKSGLLPAEPNDEDDRCSSLRALLNIDADDRVVVPEHSDGLISSCADDQCSDPFAEVCDKDGSGSQESEACRAETGNSELQSSPDDSMPTSDVAVQTEFYDDEEEENSSSDWQTSTESGSDWLVSNGSGSDWLASGGSGCDWLTGDGSGCATDEDEAEAERRVGLREEADLSNWEEAGKFWMMPDVMQDSTDTGYSSLSRDGRIVNTDCDKNNNNNSNTSSTRNNANDSSDSAKGSEDSSSRSEKSSSGRRPDSGGMMAPRGGSGARSKTPTRQNPPQEASVFDGFDIKGEFYPQRISYTFHFDGVRKKKSSCSSSCGVGHRAESRDVRSGEDEALATSCVRDRPDVCTCWVDVSGKQDTKRFEEPLYDEVYVSMAHLKQREEKQQQQQRDDLIPYPYDVTRFLDVTTPAERGPLGGGSSAPSHFDSVSSSRGSCTTSAHEKNQKTATWRRPSPRPDKAAGCAGDDYCSCDVTASESYAVTSDGTQRRLSNRGASRPVQEVTGHASHRHHHHHAPRCPQTTGHAHALSPPLTSTPRVVTSQEPAALSARNLALLSCSLQSEALNSRDPRHRQRRLPGRSGSVEAGNTAARSLGPRSFSLDDSQRPGFSRDDAPAAGRGLGEGRGVMGEGLDDGSRAFLLHDDDDDPLPTSGRSLHEVAASLEDKVSALRHERQAVDRKLREACEEEAVRRQHKARFQRLLAMHRKSVLLQTLQDLRRRLESQSARLQASYSTVLNIRKRYA